jgi:hypothetical protein
VAGALAVTWAAGGPLPASYNYGLIIFDTVSINPYWTNALYWNNYIAPSALTSSVPTGSVTAGKNVALFSYTNTTETITLGGAVGGTSVGSIDIIGASPAVTIITIP